jgi:hypothetical protein
VVAQVWDGWSFPTGLAADAAGRLYLTESGLPHNGFEQPCHRTNGPVGQRPPQPQRIPAYGLRLLLAASAAIGVGVAIRALIRARRHRR